MPKKWKIQQQSSSSSRNFTKNDKAIFFFLVKEKEKKRETKIRTIWWKAWPGASSNLGSVALSFKTKKKKKKEKIIKTAVFVTIIDHSQWSHLLVDLLVHVCALIWLQVENATAWATEKKKLSVCWIWLLPSRFVCSPLFWQFRASLSLSQLRSLWVCLVDFFLGQQQNTSFCRYFCCPLFMSVCCLHSKKKLQFL